MNRATKLAAAAAAATTLLTPATAHAVYNDDKILCGSGPSGSVCTRYQWDPAALNSRARGASDPNAGYWIQINSVELHEYYSDSSGTHDFLAREASGSQSFSFQAVYTTDYRQPSGSCSKYYARMYYTTFSGFYTQTTLTSSEKCPYV